MRTYTLAFSILVHLFLVGALVVTPIVANTELPEPRRAVEFVEVRIETPRLPAPRARGSSDRRQPSHVANPHAAPAEPPSGVTPESDDVPHNLGDPGGDPRESSIGVVGGVPVDDVVPPPPPPPPRTNTPFRVGGEISRPQKIRHVAPNYPTIAQSAGIQGTVVLDALIGEDGRVRNLRVLKSIPLLDQAAIDAVRQWQFTPTRLNGEPIAVVMTVTVTFTLQR